MTAAAPGIVGYVSRIPGGSAGVGEVRDARRLAGGDIHTTWLVTRHDGSQVVVKTTADVAPDMFAVEAEGLEAIAASEAVAAPRVLGVSATHLVMEALVPRLPGDPEPDLFWERAGRALAGMHQVRGERFGWHRDGYLGVLPQRNAWGSDGYQFYAQRRVGRYLPEPGVRAVLDGGQLAAIERICTRLPEMVPPMPPVLTHGDLAPGNILATQDGRAALIDPAVSYGWAEVDVSMIYCLRGQTVPERYFAAYQEASPLEAGWRERAPLLYLRELVSLLAHFPGKPKVIGFAMPMIEHVIDVFA
jgi:fructosamine-3-kinase